MISARDTLSFNALVFLGKSMAVSLRLKSTSLFLLWERYSLFFFDGAYSMARLLDSYSNFCGE